MTLHILARLLSLSAASYQLAAALHGYVWPKIFWDFATKSLDPLVRPVPVLQTANFLSALAAFLWEWPHPIASRLRCHQLDLFHVVGLLSAAVPALLLYQGTNAAVYYVIAAVVYTKASKGEPKPPGPRAGRLNRPGPPILIPVGRRRGVLRGMSPRPPSRVYIMLRTARNSSHTT